MGRPSSTKPRSDTSTGRVWSSRSMMAYSRPEMELPSRSDRAASSISGSTGKVSRSASTRPPRTASGGSPVAA